MCKKSMLDFFHYVENTGDHEKVKAMGIDEFCAHAYKLGFEFSLNELKEVISAVKAHKDGILNDAALSDLSGGRQPNYSGPVFSHFVATH